MFTVVKTVYKKPKGINKILAKRPTCFLNKIKVGQSFYYELTVNYSNKNIKWKKVFKSVNISDVPVIMPQNSNINFTTNIKPFASQIFSGIIYANCAKRIFKTSSKAFVIDNSFDNSATIYNLLKFFKEVSVCTADEQKYEKLTIKTENELGISPIICDNINIAQSADFVINLNDTPCEPINKNILGAGGYTFVHSDIRIPKNIGRLIPRNINLFLFSAALYELCQITELNDCTAIKLKNNLTQDIVKIKA